MLLLRGAIFLRTVPCSTYNIRCRCVCQLRRGLGLCLPCSPWRRVLRVFRGWILLLRRRLILVVGLLLFRRFRSRIPLRILELGSPYRVGLGILDTWSISLVFQRTVLLRGVGESSPLLSSRLGRMFRRGLGRACRLPVSRRLSR